MPEPKDSPNNDNSNEPQNDDPNNPPLSEELSPTTTENPTDSPTNQPAVTPPVDRNAELFRETIREQQRIIQEQNQRLTELANKVNAPPPENIDELNEQFFKTPIPLMRTEMQRMLQESIAPLQDFVSQFKRTSTYDNLKNKFRGDPRYKEVFENAESNIDEMMRQVEPTEANMTAALLTAAGMLSTGYIERKTVTPPVTSTPPANPTNRPVSTPPHLRPSAPPGPSNQPAKTKVELTENQKRLARENGMSEADYIEMMGLAPHEVATNQIGKGK